MTAKQKKTSRLTALQKMMTKKASMDPTYQLASPTTVTYYERPSLNQSKLALGYHDQNMKTLLAAYFNSPLFSRVTTKKSQES